MRSKGRAESQIWMNFRNMKLIFRFIIIKVTKHVTMTIKICCFHPKELNCYLKNEHKSKTLFLSKTFIDIYVFFQPKNSLCRPLNTNSICCPSNSIWQIQVVFLRFSFKWTFQKKSKCGQCISTRICPPDIFLYLKY